jgi:hypothetical protein
MTMITIAARTLAAAGRIRAAKYPPSTIVARPNNRLTTKKRRPSGGSTLEIAAVPRNSIVLAAM